MTHKKFDKWLNEFHEHFRKSKAWNNIQHYEQNEKDLLGYYIQFQNSEENRSLVKATWILAGATIILALATIILIFIA